MSSPFLSFEEKQKGIKHHFRYQFLNGIGFNFLGDTPVYLMAIYFGATNKELGYISSVIYVAGIFLSVMPRIFAGKNIVKLQFWAWFTRGLVCTAYAALFFLTGRPAVVLILVTYTLFCTARIVGSAVYQPVIRMLSTNRNRGQLLSSSSLRFQIPNTATKFVSFFVTSIRQLSGITGLLLLGLGGIIFNTLAALEIRKIPCRLVVQYRKGRNVFRILRESFSKKETACRIILSWLNTAMVVLFGFMIPLLKKEAGFSDSMVFLLTLTAGLANIASAFFARNFADRLGSRPLLIWMTVLLAASSLAWAFAVERLPGFVFFIFVFVSTFFLRSNELLVNRLVLGKMPEEDSVGFSSMLNFFIAFVALFFGFAGGMLADAAVPGESVLAVNSYSWTFMLAFLLCIVSLILTSRIRESGSLSAREAASIILSPANLSTYQNIVRLDNEEDPMARQTLLINIGMNNSRMATEEIRSHLATPLSSGKGQLIISLFSNPRPVLLPDLLREAGDPDSYHRLKALFALGAYPSPETEALLLGLLKDPDPAVVSNAAKSLGRIGCKSLLPEIRRLASHADGIWNRMNYAIALRNMDETGEYLRDVFPAVPAAESDSSKQTMYSLYADLLEFMPPLSDIYRNRNLKQGSGLRDFLDEAREEELFLKSHKDFWGWFEKGELEPIWTRCREILGQRDIPPYFAALTESMARFPEKVGVYDDALAAVYFTYQILKHC